MTVPGVPMPARPFRQVVTVRPRERSPEEVKAGVRGWREYVSLLCHVFHPDDGSRLVACDFRIDTGADFSFLPTAKANELGLSERPFVPVNYQSSSGPGSGRLFREVPVGLVLEAGVRLLVDLVVADGYTRNYGLLSFRDLHYNFRVETSADVKLNDPNPPINAGHWVFHPR